MFRISCISLLLICSLSFSYSQTKVENKNSLLSFKRQIILESDNGGTVSTDDIIRCLKHFAVIDYTNYKLITKDDSTIDTLYISGEDYYTGYENKISKENGEIHFKYIFKWSNNKLYINYYNFDFWVHDEKVNKNGYLPSNYDENVGQIFTEKQFKEISATMPINIAAKINIIKKCLQGVYKIKE